MSVLSRISDAAMSAAVALGFTGPPSHIDAGPQTPQGEFATGFGGWQNTMTGLGTSRDPASATTYGYQFPLPEPLRDNLYEFEPMTRIVVNRPARDLIRRGLRYKGFEGYDLQALTSKCDDLEMLRKIGRAYRWMRKDGGSAIVMIVNDGRPHCMPIDNSRLMSVYALHVLERRQISVAAWQRDPTLEGYDEPLLYYVHTGGPRSTMNLVHRDRVIRFVAGDLPFRSQLRFQGWGPSVIDRIWGPLRAKGAALSALNTILSSFAVDIVKMRGYARAVELGNRKHIQDRADAMRATLGNLSKIFIDADGEDFTPVVRSAAGLAEIIELVIDEAQAASEMPKEILRGLSPAGLNNGENAGAIRGYYDFIDGERQDYLIPPATRIIDLVSRSMIGPLQGHPPPCWEVEGAPLWTPTDSEIATIRAANATAAASDWMTGNLSREEWRSDPRLADLYDLEDEDEMADDDLGESRPFPANHKPMTTGEAAAHFGVNPGSIRTLIKSGAINSYSMNGRYVVSLQEIMSATSRAKGPAPAPAPAAPALSEAA